MSCNINSNLISWNINFTDTKISCVNMNIDITLNALIINTFKKYWHFREIKNNRIH